MYTICRFQHPIECAIAYHNYYITVRGVLATSACAIGALALAFCVCDEASTHARVCPYRGHLIVSREARLRDRIIVRYRPYAAAAQTFHMCHRVVVRGLLRVLDYICECGLDLRAVLEGRTQAD